MSHKKVAPSVSIVITCYNYADFVEEAIESALNQTYSNVDVIVINDGSTDNSLEVIKKYSSRIKIITRENKGIVYTRNEALDMVRSDYICFLDADDYLDDKYVETTLNKAIKEKADLIYTDFQMFNKSNERSSFPEYNYEHLKNRNFIHISCLMRMTAISDTRFDFGLARKSHEDWDFFMSLAVKGVKIVKCEDVILHYRVHGLGRSNIAGDSQANKQYLEVYSYIVDKNISAGHTDFNYLIGPMVNVWYSALYNEINKTQNYIKSLQERVDTQSKIIDEIKSSKRYKLAEKIAKPIELARRVFRRTK